MVKRFGVLVEIIAVFFAGTFAARYVLKALGIAGSKEAIGAASRGSFDAVSEAVPMLIRWSIVLALAFIAGRLIARHRPRDYGLTLAGRPLVWHIGAGLVALAIGFLPVLALLLARRFFHLAGGPPVWDAIDKAPRTVDFWMFVLASSVVIPPVVEELFFRGYALTRFATAFRPLTSIIVVSVLFVAAHVQYFDGSLVGTLIIPLGIWEFIVIGIARWRTGSLLPPIVAHALLNIPMRAAEQVAFAVVLLLILAVALRKGVVTWRPSNAPLLRTS